MSETAEKVREGWLKFDEPTHTYTVGGQRWPSVTQVLNRLEDWTGVDPEVLAAAREFGRHVHEAVALDIRDMLDWNSLDPALVPYLTGWRRFVDESGITILASEERVAHRRYHYAGTLDVRGILRNALALIDVKSCAVLPATVGAQTAAYENALEDWAGVKVRRRFCVILKPNDYRIFPLTNSADFSLFVSALNVYRFLEKNRVDA